MKKTRIFLALVLLLGALPLLKAQDDNKITFTGNIQFEGLVAENDSAIGTDSKGSFLSNTYVDLGLQSTHFTAGLRFEYLDNPLPGFEPDFDGWGFPHFFVTANYGKLSATVGDFYDQFGSGFIFRTYEDRALGVDNALRGARLNYNPVTGVRLKVLGGMQRVYFNFDSDNSYGLDYGQGGVFGGDLELDIDEFIAPLKKNNWHVLFGASGVSNFTPESTMVEPNDPSFILNVPNYVAAFDVRTQIQKGNYSVLAEYAVKNNDPSYDNGYTYNNGSAAMLSTSYSKRGMSLLLQAKRSENMTYRSDRNRQGSAASINHLPAFTRTQTYALAALYPYATQGLGEWAFQGELRYKLKHKTFLGGKYGTNLRASLSTVKGLQNYDVLLGIKNGQYEATTYPTTDFFAMSDEVYYTDINLSVDKKVNRSFAFHALYMYQEYNQRLIEGHGVNGDLVKAHIAILELKYRLNNNIGIRGEMQYLTTQQDLGDWAYALCEVSLYHNLMLEVSDMYNLGTTDLHYYKAGATYNYKAHRLQLAYGRTRAGYNCSGGVCRYVPASKGLSVSYIFNF